MQTVDIGPNLSRLIMESWKKLDVIEIKIVIFIVIIACVYKYAIKK